MAVPTKVMSTKRTGSPILILIAGVLFIVIFVIGTIIHIQTSEAFFGYHLSFMPHLNTLAQLVYMFHNTYNTRTTVAIVWGWTIETLFIGFMGGYEIAHESVKFHNSRLVEVFRYASLLLIGFDGWTDYAYLSPQIGILQSTVFALLICVVVFFFGTVGFGYIEKGIRDLRP